MKIGEQEKVVFVTLISIVLIVAFAVTSGKNFNIRGAATTDLSPPLFELKMDSYPSSSEEILSFEGVYETKDYQGKINNAWKFNGKGDHAIVSESQLKNLEEFTIMFWVKPSDTSLRKRAHILWQGEISPGDTATKSGNGWGDEQEFHISFGDEVGLHKYEKHKLTFYFGDQTNNLKISTPITKSDWQHVALTVKNSNLGASARLYLDGSYVAGKEVNSNIDRRKWSDKLYLGTSAGNGPPTDGDRYFIGQLDELTIHDRILTPKEIREHCRLQNNGDFC